MTALRIPDHIRAFLDEPNIASVGTTGTSGAAHQAVTWYRRDPDDRILLNSRLPRRWPTDLLRDGRVSIAVLDRGNFGRWVGLEGFVHEVVDGLEIARDHICQLAARYGDDDSETLAAFRTQPRISFLVRVTTVHDHLGEA